MNFAIFYKIVLIFFYLLKYSWIILLPPINLFYLVIYQPSAIFQAKQTNILKKNSKIYIFKNVFLFFILIKNFFTICKNYSENLRTKTKSKSRTCGKNKT